MYYALAYLIYCDGRQTSSVHFYVTKALSLCEKPKYYFLVAMNYISNGNDEYASAQPLFERVYQMKEWWDDGESNNPRFAGESDYDGSIWLNSCDTTDLYNLYVKLGYCNEINQSYADAIDYYTKALLIMPDKMKVAVGFARVAEILFHKKDVSQDVEQYMEELSEETLELLPCKWLRAELAFDEGDDELTLKLVNEIVKVKLSDEYIDSQLRDYVHFANHLKVKVYMEREKYQIAKKYLGNLLESLKNHKNRGMVENGNRTKQIYLDAIEWYTELGNHAEAEEVKRELDSLRF